MNINTCYKFVQNVANKDQKGGLVSPDRFNMLAEIAQLEVVTKRISDIKKYREGRPIPAAAYPATKKIKDDLLPLLTPYVMQVDSMGRGIRPVDYLYCDAITYTSYKNSVDCNLPGQITKEDVDVLDINQFTKRVSSKIVGPTFEYPICTFYSNHIQFAPINIGSVQFDYIRKPKTPVWGYTVSNGRPLYDPTTTQDFEVPEDIIYEIGLVIMGYLGISLSNADLATFSQMK